MKEKPHTCLPWSYTLPKGSTPGCRQEDIASARREAGPVRGALLWGAVPAAVRFAFRRPPSKRPKISISFPTYTPELPREPRIRFEAEVRSRGRATAPTNAPRAGALPGFRCYAKEMKHSVICSVSTPPPPRAVAALKPPPGTGGTRRGLPRAPRCSERPPGR